MTAWRVRGMTAGGGGTIDSSSVCGSGPGRYSQAMLWAISRRAPTAAVASTTFRVPTSRTWAFASSRSSVSSSPGFVLRSVTW